jgi:EAL domain-containing protein (putative c-di-GMP-specific phosphodiesterase class I)
VRGPNGESAAAILAQVTEANLYAFDQACRVRAIQMAAGLGLDRQLSINFLPNAVYHPESCLRVTLAAAKQYSFPASLITFEFSEKEVVEDNQHLKNIIETYRSYGFKTALDDFGSGYAGLSLLADFQPDIIKVDRKLIENVDKDKARQAIIAGLMTTAHALGMSVVAEGVERREELVAVDVLGIKLIQGFLFARPSDRLFHDHEIVW